MGFYDDDNNFIKNLASKYPMVERFESTLLQLQSVISAMNLQDSVRVDTDLLGKAIIDYFADIDRLKDFEEIDKANVNKIYGYMTFWLARRSPIQIIKNVQYKDSSVNEMVLAFILIAKMIAEKEIDYVSNSKSINVIKELHDLILYNLKYRLYTQQSMELMVTSFFSGYDCK